MTCVSWNVFSVISGRYRTISKHSQYWFSTGVLLTLFSLVTPQESVFAKTIYSLQVSSNPNRRNPVTSESKFLGGNFYIFVSPAFNLSKVKFLLDSKDNPSGSLPLLEGAKTSPLLRTSDFEQGDLGGWRKEICCRDSVQPVRAPVRSGNFALKFHLRKDDPDVAASKRAELLLSPVPSDAERWYRFSIFLPENWAPDRSMDIVAQWHEYPDFSIGESWRSPPLSLSTMDGNWRIGRIWDPNPLTLKNTPGLGGGTERIDLGGYALSVWTDWIVHVKWSYQADGLLEIWKNGNLVVQRIGPNTYNDKVGPYFKMGIYKPDWKHKPEKSTTDTRTIYFDEVHIGDKSTSYTDIAPH